MLPGGSGRVGRRDLDRSVLAMLFGLDLAECVPRAPCEHDAGRSSARSAKGGCVKMREIKPCSMLGLIACSTIALLRVGHTAHETASGTHAPIKGFGLDVL